MAKAHVVVFDKDDPLVKQGLKQAWFLKLDPGENKAHALADFLKDHIGAFLILVNNRYFWGQTTWSEERVYIDVFVTKDAAEQAVALLSSRRGRFSTIPFHVVPITIGMIRSIESRRYFH